MKKIALLLLLAFLSIASVSQTVNICVDVTKNRKNVSPYIYGRNNSLSDDSSSPLSAVDWQKLRDAGICLFRENGGNNATKYNWRLKLTSAPDWYNNVYAANWDYEAQSLQQNIPGAKAMYAFQLIGKVASSAAYNFNDWAYNQAQWWPGVAQNLAGNGTINTSYTATKALVEGNTSLYLKDWPADSTVAILDKWFGNGTGSLNLDQSAFQYWNMDNEPEIWEGTHDDVMRSQLSAENFMQKYFVVAKKARAKFPNIKLVGFVPCSEWYWFAWSDGAGHSGKISYNGSKYTWIEYFLKRIGEEQKATGIRLLDVVDLHTYLDANSVDELLQVHRVFFDKTFDYPGANGVKMTGSSDWDNSITKEYIFTRINDWLTQYLGDNHGVTVGSTESGWNDDFNQMPLALNYASTLGVFANEGVELYTPWFWSPSYWEVVHLFSRYSKPVSVQSISDDDNKLSAYSTVSADNDSLTIVMVNRYPTSKNTKVSLSNITITDGLYQVYTLSGLPDDNSTETFVSHSNNALKSSSVAVEGNAISMTLPAYSITSVILRTGASAGNYLGASTSTINLAPEAGSIDFSVYSNVSWTASSNQSWLSLSKSSGSASTTITASAVANTSSASRSATITLTGTGVGTKTITVTQSATIVYPTTELNIYNDNETLIKGTWSQNGTLSELSSGGFEGNKHYRFAYSFTNWWAGYGLNLTNWAGNGKGYDFTGYESLKFACSISNPAKVSVSLVDADGTTSTVNVDVVGLTSSYQEFTLSLASFKGMALNDVGEIMININGNSISSSGNFYIDHIRLGTKSTTSLNQTLEKPIKSLTLSNYPNPFSFSTTIKFNAPVSGKYCLKIFDFSGKEITQLLNEWLTEGNYTIDWKGTNSEGQQVSNGVYFYQLNGANQFINTKRMILIR